MARILEEQSYNITEDSFRVRITAKLKNASLASARESLGLTARELAFQSGLSYRNYLAYENLKKYPPRDIQKRICEFFGVRGVFLSEEEVFPEQLAETKSRKSYSAEISVPREKLVFLSEINQKMLPVVESDIDNLVDEVLLKDKINLALEALSDRNRVIIQMRFGLAPYNRKYTLEEIGKILDLTRERIRSLEVQAIRELQNPAVTKKLEDFLSAVINK